MIVLNQDYVLSREGDKVDITNGMTAWQEYGMIKSHILTMFLRNLVSKQENDVG